MLPHRTAKKKPLHEVSMVVINCLQMGNAFPGNPEAVKINVRSPSTPEVHRIKIVNLGLGKSDKESNYLARRIGNCGRVAAYL